jgi:hypothetical protein
MSVMFIKYFNIFGSPGSNVIPNGEVQLLADVRLLIRLPRGRRNKHSELTEMLKIPMMAKTDKLMLND